MYQLQENTLTSQNISSYIIADTYTATGSMVVMVRCLLNNIQGDGDYNIFGTLQQAGTGSEYQFQPVAGFTVESGITSIAFPSIMIPVKPNDVVRLYVEGQSTDILSVGITTTWFDLAASMAGDAMALTTLERSLLASASTVTEISGSVSAIYIDADKIDSISGSVTEISGSISAIYIDADKIDAISASVVQISGSVSLLPTSSTSASTIWTYAVREITGGSNIQLTSEITGSITNINNLIAEISGSVLYISGSMASGSSTVNASAIWEYPTRTLSSFSTLITDIWNYTTRTLTAFSGGEVLDDTDVTCRRGDTFTYPIAGLDFTDYSKVYFTIKKNYQDTDTEAIVQVVSGSSGLLYLNGVVSASPTEASLTVTSNDTATLVLKPFVTSEIPYLSSSNYHYDIQILYTTGTIRTLQYGDFILSRDVTRRIT